MYNRTNSRETVMGPTYQTGLLPVSTVNVAVLNCKTAAQNTTVDPFLKNSKLKTILFA